MKKNLIYNNGSNGRSEFLEDIISNIHQIEVNLDFCEFKYLTDKLENLKKQFQKEQAKAEWYEVALKEIEALTNYSTYCSVSEKSYVELLDTSNHIAKQALELFEEKKKDKFLNMKVCSYCWICGKEYKVTNKSPFKYGVKCECGGYLVSPSGKVRLKIKPIVQVYRLNEYDAVAAKSEDEAKEFYLKITGLDENEAFEDISIVPMDYMVWTDETRTRKISIKDLIENEWKGEPFIAFSTTVCS